jgi:hypothetical protein
MKACVERMNQGEVYWRHNLSHNKLRKFYAVTR